MPKTQDKTISNTDIPTALTGTHLFNCWCWRDMVKNNRTKTTDIASFITASFSNTWAINGSSKDCDSIIVATVSVGANMDAITNAFTTSIDGTNTVMPQAISTILKIVPKNENTSEDIQVLRRERTLNLKEEFNRMIGSNKYRNNSGAKSNGAKFNVKETTIPNTTAITELGMQFTRESFCHNITKNNNIKTTISSSPITSCSIIKKTNDVKYVCPLPR